MSSVRKSRKEKNPQTFNDFLWKIYNFKRLVILSGTEAGKRVLSFFDT